MKGSLVILLTLILLFGTISLQPTCFGQGSYQNKGDQSQSTPYWYSFEEFKYNSSDPWIPFFSLTDIPYSQPLRGFISDSRNWFVDMGAFEWFSTWIRDVWGYEVSPYEQNFTSLTTVSEQKKALEYLFLGITDRLSANGRSLDYAQDLTPPYEAWLPLIVMDNLTENGYDSLEHIINPDVVEQTLDTAFPLIDWKTDVYWYDYDNTSDFAQLVSNKTQDDLIIVDSEFVNTSDVILHNIITLHNPGTYDLIFPSLLLLLHEKILYSPGFGAIGGLGQLQSNFTEINFWSLNGRDELSYFYGGNPTKPRDTLTTTVLHELGHTIGLPHPHDNGVWILDSSTESTMTYYSRSTQFDKLDQDLVLNGLVLQLLGRYQDEITYFRGFSLNSTQQALLNDLESTMGTIPSLIFSDNIIQIKSLFYDVDDKLAQLASDSGVPRKTSDFSAQSPLLNVNVEYIIGQGFEEGEALTINLQSVLNTNRINLLDPITTLPAPAYNLKTTVHYAPAEFQNELKAFLISQLTTATTSNYDPELVSPEAWETYPLNEIFQTIEGYSIDAYEVEEWLTNNPATPDLNDTLHYRFYIFNLEGLTDETSTTSNVPSWTLSSLFLALSIVLILRKRRKQRSFE
ncbi:MAG: hypothetical protein ACFFCZ_12515 [Promethearchaeota archaeon]